MKYTFSFFLFFLLIVFNFKTMAMDVPKNYVNPIENNQVSKFTFRVTGDGVKGISSCTGSWISERSFLLAAHCANIFSAKNNPVIFQIFVDGKIDVNNLINTTIETTSSKIQFKKHPSYKGKIGFWAKVNGEVLSTAYDFAVGTIDLSVDIPEHEVSSFAPTDLVPLSGDFFYSGAGGMLASNLWSQFTEGQVNLLAGIPGLDVKNPGEKEFAFASEIFGVLLGLNTFLIPGNLNVEEKVKGFEVHAPEGLKVCKGDSGGPLLKKNSQGDLVQIGVHSLGVTEPIDLENCGSKGFDTFLDAQAIVWITERMNEFERLDKFTGISVYGASWISFITHGVTINGLKIK